MDTAALLLATGKDRAPRACTSRLHVVKALGQPLHVASSPSSNNVDMVFIRVV